MITNLPQDVVLGPIDHPRFGRSLVVRPTVGNGRSLRLPTQAVVVTTAARHLIALSKAGDRIQSLLVEGGETDPTLHPEFPEISQNLREVLAKWFPKAKLCLLSEAPDLSRPQVRHALVFYHQPIVQLEAGTVKTAAARAGERGKQLKQLVGELGRLAIERLIVQGTFVRGEVDNSKDSEIKAWIRNLVEIKPAGIHITTPPKPRGNGERPVTKARMSEIAELVSEKTGVPVEVCAS